MAGASEWRSSVLGIGGLSAACARAAERGESRAARGEDHLSNTIYRYQGQVRWTVNPSLRSPVRSRPFAETILGSWDESAKNLKTNVRYKREVKQSENRRRLRPVPCRQAVQADFIVFGIGLRQRCKLGCGQLPFVQTSSSTAGRYEGETIVVIGAGDAAIENAVALSKQNNVVIVNRRTVQPGQERQRTGDPRGDRGRRHRVLLRSGPERVDALTAGRKRPHDPQHLDRQSAILIDRVIARLGAAAPRGFVEACGVTFRTGSGLCASDQLAVRIQRQGPHIVGALGGYPLIKQAMNGATRSSNTSSVTRSSGRRAAAPSKFVNVPGFRSVDEALEQVQKNAPRSRPGAAAVAEFARLGDPHAEAGRADLPAQRLRIPSSASSTATCRCCSTKASSARSSAASSSAR
jgi:hypothetical protein